jgi:hypothetical protein
MSSRSRGGTALLAECLKGIPLTVGAHTGVFIRRAYALEAEAGSPERAQNAHNGVPNECRSNVEIFVESADVGGRGRVSQQKLP